jgi:hypothetical protein
VQGANAWYQIKVNVCKKDGHRAQISSIGLKFLYDIHPNSFSKLVLGICSKNLVTKVRYQKFVIYTCFQGWKTKIN